MLIASVYGKYCTRPPVQHLGGTIAQHAIRVGPDSWHAGYDRRQVDGKWTVGVLLTRRVNVHSEEEKGLETWFLPMDELDRIGIVFKGYFEAK